jgi:hypothetical protein
LLVCGYPKERHLGRAPSAQPVFRFNVERRGYPVRWGCLSANLGYSGASINLTTNTNGRKLCGYSITTPLLGCPIIWVYTDMIDSVLDDHFRSGAPFHIVLLHEALHTCGVDHPDGLRGDNNCNRIMACCMLTATGYLPTSVHCTLMITHPG